LVAVRAGEDESVARTVKLKVPAVVGVPLRTPAELRFRSVGSVPLLTTHVYGAFAPVAASWVEGYATPTVPPGNDVVLIVTVACTVKLALPETEPLVAVIVVVPAATAVASPDAFMVATAVFEDDHVTWLVMFWVLLSEYVPVAVNCWVAPATIEGFAGVTAIEFRVAGGVELNTTSTQ